MAEADRILSRYSSLQSDRSNFEQMWQQIAERALPGSASFQTQRTPGEQRTERMYDATAALALRKFATIIESITTPRNARYHRLTTVDEELAEDHAVKVYLDEVNTLLFKARYAPTANFAGQVGGVRLELAAFGTASMYVDDSPQGLRYRALPLAETYFSENHVGLVDTVCRVFQRTARQAVQQWGDRCPDAIRQAVEKSPDARFTFVHMIEPNDGSREERLRADQAYRSIYVSETGRAVLSVGGYYTWPVPITRDLTSAGEVYGRSPATWVLPDIKMLNEMNRTVIRAGHKAVDPPILTVEDGALSAFDMRPGAVNPGGLGPNGEELAKPFQSGARLDIGAELMDRKAQVINEAFYITLFQILVDNPRMTATEVLERAAEKGMLLGPLAGRDQSEFLGPMVERELDLLARAGRLPQMPEALLEAGGEYKIEYEGPLARAQKSQDGVAIMRTLEGVMPLVATNPEVLDNYDLDQISRSLGEINGMPSKLLRSTDAVAKMRDDRSQQQDVAEMVNAAPGMARAVRDVAQVA